MCHETINEDTNHRCKCDLSLMNIAKRRIRIKEKKREREQYDVTAPIIINDCFIIV